MIKRLLKFVLILVVFVSCSTDDFYKTKRILQTDKTDYKIGGKISLTLKIQPEKSEKQIRIYRNYQNLQVSFSLLNNDVHNSNWKIDNRENVPNSEIESITITKHKPFEKTFAGNIIDNTDSVKIEFLELNTSANFAKKI